MAEPSLRRFRPAASAPWDEVRAAHLLNRAGFGGRPEEVRRLVALGPDGAVEELLGYERTPEAFPPPDYSELGRLAEEAEALRRTGADEAARRALAQRIVRAQREALQATREWWVARMVQTHRPLQEKMVLFWHGLLVSGFPEVRNPVLLYQQNELFRRMALGNFKALILAISRDPAMLTYLDNASNRKGRPNENYARELLELFTMGIGHYTEQDVKEAARAFTGWTFRGTEFVFNRAQHDDGVKTFLGRTGPFDGTDVIDIIFEQPATARFLPRRLFEFFAGYRPPDGLVEELARTFRAVDFEVGPLVRTILRSEAFYAPQALRAQVKSPAQLVIGTARLLGLGSEAARALTLAMDLMGQALLIPPHVGGWPSGEGWITTSTILVRYNFAGLLTNGQMPGVPRRAAGGLRPVEVAGLLDGAETAGEAVAALIRRFLPGAVLDRKRTFALLRALGANRPTDPVRFTPQRVRTALHLILSMPEYQLC